MKITFVCSEVCGGKTTIANKLNLATLGDISFLMEISTIVLEILGPDKELRKSANNLADRIIEEITERIETLLSEFPSEKLHIIISGVREVKILQHFHQNHRNCSFIWISTPYEERLSRFMTRHDEAKDRSFTKTRFDEIIERDKEIGILAVKQFIFQVS